MNTDSLAQLMTAREVARLLRVRTTTVYEAAASGRIPAVRVWQGKRRALIRFRRADVEAILQPKQNALDR